MGEKIWFVYISDHHEGPFTPEEVKQKIAEGAVTLQSLVWKDGMPEWVSAESLPEIRELFSGAPAEASLAQLLSQNQEGSPFPLEAAPASDTASAGAVPAALSASTDGGAAQEPGEDDLVWSMRSGTTVTGQFSMATLREMAGRGEIPGDAEFWHPGMTDFSPLSSYPALEQARKPLRAAPKPLAAAPQARKPGGLAPLVAGATIDREPDTGPVTAQKPVGFTEKLKGLFSFQFGKKKVAKAVAEAKAPVKTKKPSAVQGKLAKVLKPVVTVLAVALVVGGGGAIYLTVFSSPVPDLEDVLPDTLEEMKKVVKVSAEAGGKLLLVQAQGDDVTPTFYVATNLPEGTQVKLKLDGMPGTLVNAVAFSQSWTAPVEKTQLAVFRSLNVEGKPLPMGDYKVKLTANGATEVALDRFVGGKKNHIYDRRMKTWREKLQGEFDKEVAEIKETVLSVKSVQAELLKLMQEAKSPQLTQAQRELLQRKWDKFSAESDSFSRELRDRLTAQMNSSTFQERFFPEFTKEIVFLIERQGQIRAKERERLRTFAAKAEDPAEAEYFSRFENLEKSVAEAATRNPLDVLVERAASTQAPASGGAVEPVDTAPAAKAAPAATSATPAASAAPAAADEP